LKDFKEYITKCNSFFPRVREQTYLKDICIQDGGQCLQVSAGCCCGINPLVPTNAPTAAPTLAPTFAPTFPPTPAPPTEAPTAAPGDDDGAGAGDGAAGGKKSDDDLSGDDDFFKDDDSGSTTTQRVLDSITDGAVTTEVATSQAEEENRVSRNLQTALPGMCNAGQVCKLGDNAKFGVDVTPWTKNLQIKFGEFADAQCKSRVEGRAITTEGMFAQCKAFCGEGAVPVVLGSDTFGLNLEQMNNVCLNSKGILADAKNMEVAKKCPAKKQALRDVENSVADFLASLRVLNYGKLRFVSDIRENVEAVEKKLKQPGFADRMSRSDDKAKVLRRIYGQYLGGLKGDALGTFDLTADADRLADKAEMMEQMMNSKMKRVIEFFDECDNYYPIDGTEKTFLLDICRQSGSKCLTGDAPKKAVHAGCCCGHNPLVKLNSMLKAVRKGGRHLQQATQSPCGKALAKSESEVTQMKEKTSPTELTRSAVNEIEFGGVCGRAEQAAQQQVKQYEQRTTHPQVQAAKAAMEKKYAGDVPLEPLPEGGCKVDLFETDKSATCKFSSCGKSRNAVCVGGHCQCKKGTCSDRKTSKATCVENESAAHNEEIRCVADLTETDKTATCNFMFPCRADRLATCKGGKCVCDGGNICSNRAKANAKCFVQKFPTPFPAPGPTPPPPTPPPCVSDLSLTDSKATCRVFGCSSSRNAKCVRHKCVCPPGSCSNGGGKGKARCIPQMLGGHVFNNEGTLSEAASMSESAVSAGNSNASTEEVAVSAAVAGVVGLALAVIGVAIGLLVRRRTQSSGEQPTPVSASMQNSEAMQAL